MTTLIVLLLLSSALIFGVQWTRAEPYPDRTRLTWLERKVISLRHERDWARAELRAERRRARKQRVHRPSSLEAIRLASHAYGVPYSQMLAVALCETGGTLDEHAKNRSSSASGLFQFLYPSTWRRTPYRSESVWSPYANALAAGWLWRANGGSWREWSCRP